ncbi:phospholipase A and acyltransferase 3-like isoform X2 [Heptranchias perlo]|uniref:phospholipase A and acyltransferase 3-like isoform X2 n=1 Tax=Heptranchias perlo TaxID=212740 RepID=UPI00355A1D61
MDQGNSKDGLKEGDLIERLSIGYQHWGVCTGDTVIHFGPADMSSSGSSKPVLDLTVPGLVREDSLNDFIGNHKFKVHKYTWSFSPDEIVKRARGRIGQEPYKLSENNCEHFATDVAGHRRSAQVESIQQHGKNFLHHLFKNPFG